MHYHFQLCFGEQKFLILVKSSVSFFLFCSLDFCVLVKKCLPDPSSVRLFPVFFKKFYSFVVTFRTMIHLESIFIYGVR